MRIESWVGMKAVLQLMCGGRIAAGVSVRVAVSMWCSRAIGKRLRSSRLPGRFMKARARAARGAKRRRRKRVLPAGQVNDSDVERRACRIAAPKPFGEGAIDVSRGSVQQRQVVPRRFELWRQRQGFLAFDFALRGIAFEK